MTAVLKSEANSLPHALSPYRDVSDWPVFICLLGGFRLLKNGCPLALRNATKTRSLLCSLALQDRYCVSREYLLQTLWPDTAQNLAGQALNSLVHSVYKLLGDIIGGATPITYADGYYSLNVEAGIGVDVVQFATLARTGLQHAQAGQHQAAIGCYEQAASYYRGDVCSIPDAPALILCEALRAQYLTILAHLSDHYFALSDYPQCLQYAQRLLAADPCREDAHRMVMRCYVRQGERAQALHQYRVCANLLRTEFDAAPETATEELYQQIRLTPDAV